MEVWKKKIAVVTGASSGIGAEVVKDLANCGVTVIGLARRVDKIDELANKCKNAPGKIHSFECDISKLESIKAAFQWVDTTFGAVHILINNAGRSKNGEMLSTTLPDDEIISTIDTNLTGLVMCTREAYKLMTKHNEYAFIVNVNSILGHGSPIPFFSFSNIYPATKHAVTNHTEQIRLDLAAANNKRIRVASISPGVVKTEIIEKAGGSNEYYDGRPHLTPEDVSDAIIHILSTPPNVNITELIIKPTGEIF